MPSLPIFRAGFRCFFVGAAAFSSIAIVLWVARLALNSGPPHLNLAWHAHEMLFGYVLAVLAGFLTIRLSGPRLAFLFGLWLAARALLAISDPTLSLAGAALDLLFIPALIALREPALWSVLKWPNGVFLPLLAALWLANLGFHVSMHGDSIGFVGPGLRDAALDLFAILLVAIGGRLIPGYTGATLLYVRPPRRPSLEFTSILSLVLAVAAHIGNRTALAGIFLIVAAVTESLRLITWQPWSTRRHPLLWILHLGYGWLIGALALRAMADLLPGSLPSSSALHALTAGAIGSLTIGMMTRLTLIHTRQPLKADAASIVAFLLVQLAALVRVIGPLVIPARADTAFVAAALFWSTAFALWLTQHARSLLSAARRTSQNPALFAPAQGTKPENP